MLRYFFNRNGAIVCSRDTKEECLDYAKRQMGWDVHLGADTYRDAFGGTHTTTYKVEEHELLPSMSYIRTYQDQVLSTADAIHPYPSR